MNENNFQNSKFKIQNFIRSEHLIAEGQRVLLAVSGGRDSVVLAHLFHELAIPFAIAHCNFHLRPRDCERDENFVRQLADEYGVPFHVAQFHTADYAVRQHLSVEEAAREQRYAFFESVRCEAGYDLIATAHHRDDSIETFFINLLRGTGIHGLCGIPARNGFIVRPMLCLSRDDVNQYVEQHGLQYVEDYTNSQTLYLRNRIRLQLIPLLRQLSPSFDSTMQSNIEHLSGAAQLFDSAIDSIRSSFMKQEPVAPIQPIQNSKFNFQFSTLSSTVLYELLKPFGFTSGTVSDIARSLNGRSGLRFYSPTHCLVKDRTSLIVTPIAEQDDTHITIDRDDLTAPLALSPDQLLTFKIHLSAHVLVGTSKISKNDLLLDLDTLHFPLIFRHWHHGDRFRPFGMKGSRLVSDYFSDIKLSLPDKERVWLMCDADDNILWIVGMRASAHHPVTDRTRHILHATLSPPPACHTSPPASAGTHTPCTRLP